LLSGLTAFFPFNWDKPQAVFSDRKTAEQVVTELLERKIQVRSIGFSNVGSSNRPPEESFVIRVSTAYFNTAGQIEIFRKALKEVLMRIG